MIPPAAALASALATATAQDWRWMECEGGTQYASLRLPCGAVVVVTAPPHTKPADAVAQVRGAIISQPPSTPT